MILLTKCNSSGSAETPILLPENSFYFESSPQGEGAWCTNCTNLEDYFRVKESLEEIAQKIANTSGKGYVS